MTNTTSGSFPSAHSIGGNIAALTYAVMMPEAYQDLMLSAQTFGLSRNIFGVHYPTDIIGGRIVAYYTMAQALANNPSFVAGDYRRRPAVDGGHAARGDRGRRAHALCRLRHQRGGLHRQRRLPDGGAVHRGQPGLCRADQLRAARDRPDQSRAGRSGQRRAADRLALSLSQCQPVERRAGQHRAAVGRRRSTTAPAGRGSTCSRRPAATAPSPPTSR